jgi:large subunit ribosomal protein L18
MRIRELEVLRLSVNKTPRHIYAQITTYDGAKTLFSASTLDKQLKSSLKQTGNAEAAKAVGKLIAERAMEGGIRKVAFDRSGFPFHGRVKALADSAREIGLEF